MSSNEDDPATEAILIVEDDQALRSLLEEELQEAGYPVESVDSAESAWELLQQQPIAVVLSDLKLPYADGMNLLAKISELSLPPAFIMITAFGTVEQAVEALKQGADDFMTKPLKLDHLRLCVSRVLDNRRLQEEVKRYRRLLADNGFHGILGRSRAIHRLVDHIRHIAGAGGPVLVMGESGTGKELVAQAIHDESARSEHSFVAVNCAGIPSELLESELFGHAAGAFTGAQKSRKGLFAEANGGTLFLDEIGEMPLEMQAKLLRILQDGCIRPVGSNHETRLDVRIIAATNRSLEQDVKDQRFREDLYYRLETFMIEVPPLRERGDDIELLTARFIDLYSTRLQKSVNGIASDALTQLRRYEFPGNVRELASIIERAVAFCQSSQLTINDLPERLRHHSTNLTISATNDLLEELVDTQQLPTLQVLEQRYIQYVLDRLNGNKRRAAELLDIGRRTLYRRLDQDETTTEKDSLPE